eukprot:1156053-Pelagomonas_calceolata.AAC.4
MLRAMPSMEQQKERQLQQLLALWRSFPRSFPSLILLGLLHTKFCLQLALEQARKLVEGVTQGDLEASQQLLKGDDSMVLEEEGMSKWETTVKLRGSVARGHQAQPDCFCLLGSYADCCSA